MPSSPRASTASAVSLPWHSASNPSLKLRACERNVSSRASRATLASFWPVTIPAATHLASNASTGRVGYDLEVRIAELEAIACIAKEVDKQMTRLV